MAEKEYIERGAVLRHIFDQIEEFGDPDPIDSPVARGSLMGLKYAHSVVSVLPAADVVEVRRGEWVLKEKAHYFKCSLCKEPIRYKFGYAGSKRYHNYCPNCGAKMDGERKEK